jgi:hypothetical protein
MPKNNWSWFSIDNNAYCKCRECQSDLHDASGSVLCHFVFWQTMAEAPPTLSLSGKRFVLRDQRKGTIRGVFALPIASKSPIPSQPDSSTTEFLGVEWDHPAYGKHDGVYNGMS